MLTELWQMTFHKRSLTYSSTSVSFDSCLWDVGIWDHWRSPEEGPLTFPAGPFSRDGLPVAQVAPVLSYWLEGQESTAPKGD